VNYVGRVLKYSEGPDCYTLVYVMWDEDIMMTSRFNDMTRMIQVLTLDDIGHRMPSDQTWNWYYDPRKGLEDVWEVVL
jgi:hypothetical protein